jgi:hypothetical protein
LLLRANDLGFRAEPCEARATFVVRNITMLLKNVSHGEINLPTFEPALTLDGFSVYAKIA